MMRPAQWWWLVGVLSLTFGINLMTFLRTMGVM
jgi:hypothetical protein